MTDLPTPDPAGQPALDDEFARTLALPLHELLDQLERDGEDTRQLLSAGGTSGTVNDHFSRLWERGVFERQKLNDATERDGDTAFVCEVCGEPARPQRWGRHRLCDLDFTAEESYAKGDEDRRAWSESQQRHTLLDRSFVPLTPPRLDVPPPHVSWTAADLEQIRRSLGGRPPWSGGYFLDRDDFITATVAALVALLHLEQEPTQENLLGWFADNRDEQFRKTATTRVSAWCARAGVPWEELKQRAVQEFRVGLADSNPPSDRRG